jgi:prepilin peptidase CpaA
MGMGDQKLLMAVGVWAGAAETYRLFAYAIVISLAVLACQPQRWRRTLRNLRTLAAGWAAHREIWLPERGESALSLPFAVCLFAACCLRLWKG